MDSTNPRECDAGRQPTSASAVGVQHGQTSPWHSQEPTPLGADSHRGDLSEFGTTTGSNGLDAEPVLLTAAHGFFQFAINRHTFDRSLYYNLLLQPRVAIPDHYLVQGRWMGEHLKSYPARDSWLECGLRNNFITPYFRQESNSLLKVLNDMEKSDRRGFAKDAKSIAERIDLTPYKARYWGSATNSEGFGNALARYMGSATPPILENSVDPDHFIGFWHRSRQWVDEDLARARELSSSLLGADGILLSQLIQVSGERFLGSDCGRIGSVDSLLQLVRERAGITAVRDLQAFYKCACEIYNRNLADTLQTAPNSPRWNHFVAAMDIWSDNLAADKVYDSEESGHAKFEFSEMIRLPNPKYLRQVSGDTLIAIRKSPACVRYLESLSNWRTTPHSNARQGELVEALNRYAEEIRKQVGKEVGVLGLRPQFISKSSDVAQVLERGPGLVHGFLAGGTVGTAIGILPPMAAAGVSASLFTLFCLQVATKHSSPSQPVQVNLSPLTGVRPYPDVTVSRA